MEIKSTLYWQYGRELGINTGFTDLIELGLFEEIPTDELKAEGHEESYGIRITPLGEETQKYLYAVAAELVNQLSLETPNP